jgi:biopolymer transport protein ExbD
MRSSRRIRRMSRNRGKIGQMNLTSLMDVFTILVFFLLVNSGSVEVLEAPKTVVLPESKVETKPRETVVIYVSAEQVLVQGQAVALVADIIGNQSSTIDAITIRLAELQESVIGRSTETVTSSREVTILADKSIPFDVIRKVMSTCTNGGYENVSLGVIQKPSLAHAS